MKELFLRVLVVFFLFEVSLPLYMDLYPEVNIEVNEIEKESESEKEKELDKEKRKIKGDQFYLSLTNEMNSDDCHISDPFRILENEFFDLYDPPPEC